MCRRRMSLFARSCSEPLLFVIRTDNQPAIKLDHNDPSGDRTEYVGGKYRIVSGHIPNSRIDVEYCPTSRITYNVVKKPLPMIQ